MVKIIDEEIFQEKTLGSNFMNGMEPQVIVPAKVWQETRLVPGGKWALFGTAMAPRFEYEDFELGDRAQLMKLFPMLA